MRGRVENIKSEVVVRKKNRRNGMITVILCSPISSLKNTQSVLGNYFGNF